MAKSKHITGIAIPKSGKTPKKFPTWIKAIPEGLHGSGTYQKRLWKLVSDYVRIRDWYQFEGSCVATGVYIPHWKEGQAGHFRAYATCNGMFKFDIWNVHMQTATSNYFSDLKGDKREGYTFGRELTRRYGEGFLDELEEENKRHLNEKMEVYKVVLEMQEILDLMKDLPEKPDYYDRVQMLREEQKLSTTTP